MDLLQTLHCSMRISEIEKQKEESMNVPFTEWSAINLICDLMVPREDKKYMHIGLSRDLEKYGNKVIRPGLWSGVVLDGVMLWSEVVDVVNTDML